MFNWLHICRARDLQRYLVLILYMLMTTSKTSFLSLLLLLIAFPVLISGNGCASGNIDNIERQHKIEKALFGNGYTEMAVDVSTYLSALLSAAYLRNNNTATPITILCPPEKVFSDFEMLQSNPDFMLIQYHTIPMKLDKDQLNSKLQPGSKIKTLLHGHDITVTTETNGGGASLDNVSISQWDMYNDGLVIIHGLHDSLKSIDTFWNWYRTDIKPIDHITNDSHVEKIRNALADTMHQTHCGVLSLWMEQYLPAILSQASLKNNGTTPAITIFCPQDGSFEGTVIRDIDPIQSLLLQYHIVPMRLERKDLESVGSTIDTLVPGHPLTVTSLQQAGSVSVNNATIKEWAIYDDGLVVVHGVDKVLESHTNFWVWYWASINNISDNYNGSCNTVNS